MRLIAFKKECQKLCQDLTEFRGGLCEDLK